MQLNESTDVLNHNQLLIFVRYVHEKNIKTEFLFCERLKTTTKADDVFRLIQLLFDRHEIAWDFIGSICTDGARAVIDKKSGFVALVKEKAKHMLNTHCVLHRQALAPKTLPKKIKNVMRIVMQTVNFIHERALNHRLFQKFSIEIGTKHCALLYHTEVCWLSHDRVFACIVEIQDKIFEFLKH